jgi:hypothetical protein
MERAIQELVERLDGRREPVVELPRRFFSFSRPFGLGARSPFCAEAAPVVVSEEHSADP